MDSGEKCERLIEAASAVLNAAPEHRLNTVVLNKTLFYLDLASLRDRAETITGNTYIAIQQGPVVAKYPQRLIEQLEARGIARQISEWDGSKPVLLESCPRHFQYLDSDTLILLSAVTTYFAERTSRLASEYSHENPGWRLAWNSFLRTGKPCPINMRVALQQIVDLDLPHLGVHHAPFDQFAQGGEDAVTDAGGDAVFDHAPDHRAGCGRHGEQYLADVVLRDQGGQVVDASEHRQPGNAQTDLGFVVIDEADHAELETPSPVDFLAQADPG